MRQEMLTLLTREQFMNIGSRILSNFLGVSMQSVSGVEGEPDPAPGETGGTA